MHPKRRVRTGVAHRRNLRPTREGRLARESSGPISGDFRGVARNQGFEFHFEHPPLPNRPFLSPDKKAGFRLYCGECRWIGSEGGAKGFSLREVVSVGENYWPKCTSVSITGVGERFRGIWNAWLRFMFDRSNWISLLVCLQRIRRVA